MANNASLTSQCPKYLSPVGLVFCPLQGLDGSESPSSGRIKCPRHRQFCGFRARRSSDVSTPCGAGLEQHQEPAECYCRSIGQGPGDAQHTAKGGRLGAEKPPEFTKMG